MIILQSDYSSQSIAVINQQRVNEPSGQRDVKHNKGKWVIMRKKHHCYLFIFSPDITCTWEAEGPASERVGDNQRRQNCFL